MLNPIGNFPAGYECKEAAWEATEVIMSTWLVPGGVPVYVCSTCTPAEAITELYWERVVERVQHHVRSRQLNLLSASKGLSTHQWVALSDKPLTGVIHVPPIIEAARDAANEQVYTA